MTSHGKTYTNVLTFNGLKGQLAVSHRQSAVSVTIYCDTPCVRDLGALFGHVIKQPILT